jgi:hypothetical protein
MAKPFPERDKAPWGDGDPDGEDDTGTFPAPGYGDVEYPPPTRAPESNMPGSDAG